MSNRKSNKTNDYLFFFGNFAKKLYTFNILKFKRYAYIKADQRRDRACYQGS